MEVAIHPHISVHHPSFLVAHTVAKLLVSVKGVCGVSSSLLQGFVKQRDALAVSDRKGR